MSERPGDIQPATRPLRVFAFDPMLGRVATNRVTIEVPWERLQPGPVGSRIEVVDYDGSRDCYYMAADLDLPELAMQHGLPPSESDPRFHQQMVYAVAARVLQNFDRAMGRRIDFYRSRRLRLLPHAFVGSNAFYDPGLVAVLFGYFTADAHNPGPNLPNQTVFTCLSQDIIAHEVTHAVIHRLRPRFSDPTNLDVPAFHEGFADIVAIFQHFSLPGVLRESVRQTRGDLGSSTPLVQLAVEFGNATGTGRALRTALDKEPDPRRYERVSEPHARGSILVAAVFDGFVSAYRRRIEPLIRIATGGSGHLPEGDLLPDLVDRIAVDCARTAQDVLTMCIRAIDYMAPVNPTFGDFLRALVTADFDLAPADELGLRAGMIEAFRRRGIYPDGVPSLAEDSLLLEPAGDLPALPPDAAPLLQRLLFYGAQGVTRGAKPPLVFEDAEARRAFEPPAFEVAQFVAPEDPRVELQRNIAMVLSAYARDNRARLGLREDLPPSIESFHPVHRVAPDGSLLIETVVQIVQTEKDPDPALGGVTLRGGITLVIRADGSIRYAIAKPLSPEARHGVERLLASFDRRDPRRNYADERALGNRLARAMEFSRLCEGRPS